MSAPMVEKPMNGYFITSPEGKIIDVNPKGIRMLGYDTKEEILALDLEKDVYAHPMDRKKILAMVDEEGYAEYDFLIRKKNGERILAHCSLTAMKKSMGKIDSYQGVIRDITERKMVEKQLALLAFALDHVREEAYLINESGHFLYVNEEACQVLGYKQDELLKMGVTDIVAGYPGNEWRNHFSDLKTTGVLSFETSHRNREGVIFPVAINVTYLEYDGAGYGLALVKDISLQKETEAMLRRSEREFRTLAENNPDPIFRYDREFRRLYANPVVERILQRPREELIGSPPADGRILVPEQAQKLMHAIKKAFDTGRIQKIDLDFIAPDGGHRDYDMVIVPEHDTDGRVETVLALARDLTELKQAERNRLANLRYFECMDRINRIIQGSDDLNKMMSGVMDAVLSIFDCDRAYLLYPCDPDAPCWTIPMESTRPEYPGAFISEDVIPMDEQVALTFRILLDAGGPVKFGPGTGNDIPAVSAEFFTLKSFMAMAVYPKIEKPWQFGIHQCSFPRVWAPEEERLFEEIGRRIGDALTVVLAYRKLRQSELRYREIFENTSDIIMISEVTEDGHFQLLDHNPACEKTVWFGHDLRIGGNLDEFFFSEAVPGFERQLYACIENRLPIRFEQKINTAKGQQIFEIMLIPVNDAIGNVYRMVMMGRDITRKRLLETRLLQTQKMEAMGQLVGGIAHDFSNMLGVIVIRAQMALSMINPAQDMYSSLQEILKAAERSGTLTRQLLGFARKQPVAPLALDLNETIETSLKMLRRLIGENINLVWQPCRDLWAIRMDPAQVDQVLTNLCINSRDAVTGSGTISIGTDMEIFNEFRVTGHPEAVPGEYVVLIVHDNGQGMDQDTLDRIFEPFFTTKEIGKGTGLGLSTVYGIIKQNNGFIEVFSAPEQGTDFRIYLPRNRTEAVSIPKTEPLIPDLKENETILLVEDEPAFLRTTRDILETLGYRVIEAPAAEDAIRAAARISSDPIHLMLTDVIMPGMNGRELSTHITAFHPETRCLFMSGYPSDIISRHGILDPGIHFIQKPFSAQALALKLREVLDTGETKPISHPMERS